jgi:hypothetical protein
MGCSVFYLHVVGAVEEGCGEVDPITLIVAALAAGVSAGIGEAGSQAVKDAYGGLKALIKKSFAGNAKAEETLADHEADPDTYAKPLAKQLESAGVQDDPEIVQKAEELLRKAAAAGIKTKYNVQVTGGKIGIIGDHGHIETMS